VRQVLILTFGFNAYVYILQFAKYDGDGILIIIHTFASFAEYKSGITTRRLLKAVIYSAASRKTV